MTCQLAYTIPDLGEGMTQLAGASEVERAEKIEDTDAGKASTQYVEWTLEDRGHSA